MRGAIVWVSLIVASCGTPATGADASVEGPFSPGVSGGPLSNRLEVIAVDALTREPVEALVIVDVPERHEGSSPFVLEGAEAIDRADVMVVTPDSPSWSMTLRGVRGARVVIPVPRLRPEPVEVEVQGGSAIGAASVEVTALAPLQLLRSGGVGAPSSACESLEPCLVTVDAPAGSSGLVAIARDADGAAIAVATAAADASVITLDASSIVSLDVALPSAPEGLDAVVGVPGLTQRGALALLAPAAPAFVVPPLNDGDASWWLLARAEGELTSSTVIQRELRDPADVAAWPAFLPAPTRTRIDAESVTLTAPEGATLYVIEELVPIGAGREQVVRTTLTFEPPDPVSSSARVVLRAFDAGAVDPGALDLDAIQARIVRWSEASTH